MQTKTKIILLTIQTSFALSSQPKKVKNFYHEMIHNTFINNNKIPLGNIVKRPYPLRIESRVTKMTFQSKVLINMTVGTTSLTKLQLNLMEEGLVNSH